MQVEGKLIKFIPDGLCFLSKVGADEICCEEALGRYLKVSNGSLGKRSSLI